MTRVYERAALTVCACAMVVMAANAVAGRVGAAARDERYDELTVRRLRVVDASGATRLVLTGKPIPAGTIGGKRIPQDMRSGFDGAGLMFYNDDGDEQGGLTYSGHGGTQSEALTFDSWHQDQSLEIQHGDGPGQSDSYIAGSEMPPTNLYDDVVEYSKALDAAKTGEDRAALRRRWRREGRWGYQRWIVGNRGGTSQLALNDAKGHARLRLQVTEDGDARVEFLDADGKVTKSVTP